MQDITRASSDKIARMGIAFCPEERGIFASLDVRENLLLPPIVRPGGLSLDQIFELFPNLKERLNSQGTKLSGGEQQMLAIARILRTGARFLMLDEPTEGLAPVIIQQIGHTIARLKSEGFTILLVEQNFRFASTVADRYYIVEHGKVIDGFANSELSSQHGQAPHLSRRLIGNCGCTQDSWRYHETSNFGLLARHRAGACRRRRRLRAGQDHQDRRADRQFRTLLRPRRRRLHGCRPDG